MIDYDASRVALFQCGLRPTVFSAERPKLEIEALCAECARLAYLKFDTDPTQAQQLEQALQKAGIRDWKAFGDDCRPLKGQSTGTAGFTALLPDNRALIVFRGTDPDDVSDLETDVRLDLVRWNSDDPAPGMVHEGFRDAFQSVRQAIEHRLAGWAEDHAEQKLVLTGHSLGGALATLAASWFKASLLITFGSPRVGDAAFVKTIPSTISRYVDCCDIVTDLPPALPGLFVHAGKMKYIDREGSIHTRISDQAVLADRLAAQAEYTVDYAWRSGNVIVRQLADHAPINYIRALI